MKVLLVGLHHKPGKTALCSSTHSGKVMDELIDLVRPIQVEKTNLFSANFIPIDPMEAAGWWWERVKPEANDLIILLGRDVAKYFNIRQVACIKIDHPARRMSNYNKWKYLLNAAYQISEHFQSFTSPSDGAQTTDA